MDIVKPRFMKNRHSYALNEFVKRNKPLIKDGYINTDLDWFSPKDLEKRFGKSRQYWCKIITQGKLKSHKTLASPIVTAEQIIEWYERKAL